jgi:hypothetical protein
MSEVHSRTYAVPRSSCTPHHGNKARHIRTQGDSTSAKPQLRRGGGGKEGGEGEERVQHGGEGWKSTHRLKKCWMQNIRAYTPTNAMVNQGVAMEMAMVLPKWMLCTVTLP